MLLKNRQKGRHAAKEDGKIYNIKTSKLTKQSNANKMPNIY